MMLKKLIKHSCIGLLGTTVGFFANYHLISQNFTQVEKLSIPTVNLTTVNAVRNALSETRTSVEKFEVATSLYQFEKSVPVVKKEIALVKVKKVEERPTYKMVKKVVTFKPEKVKAAKISLSKMKLEKKSFKDSVNLPTHKGIELYGFNKLQNIESTNFAALWSKTSQRIAEIEKEQKKLIVNEDRISTKLAATETSPSKMTTQNKPSEEKVESVMNSNPLKDEEVQLVQNEEPLLIDITSEVKTSLIHEKSLAQNEVKEFQPEEKSLSAPSSNEVSAVTTSVVSNNQTVEAEPLMFDVDKANEDVKKSPKKVASVSKNEDKSSEKNDALVVFDYEKKSEYSFCSEEKQRKVYDTSLSISPKLVHLGNRKTTKLENFEVKFKDDLYNSLFSSGSDPVVLRTSLNGEMNIRRATIFSKDIIPTTSDFVYELEPVVVNLPTISRDSFNELVSSQNLRAQGGHILIELGDMTESADLLSTTRYEKKLYLDSNYRVVNRGDAEYIYILYVGVEAGNTILTYKSWKNETSSKIIHVANDEIYYDFNLYVEESQDQFEICEESVLSKKPTEYYLSSNEVKSFSFDTKIKNLGLNTFGIDRSVLPLGTRKYYSLGDAENNIFIGRFENEQVIIPSLVYRSFVLENFGLRKLASQCIVQVNLKKPAISLNYEGESSQGYMRVDKLLLDRDGQFYEDFSETTQKLFFLGETQGIINVKVDYADGSHDYLMTYCSESTYLVEQL